MKRLGMLVMGLLLMGVCLSYADVPKEISLQGRLTNSSGVALPDGNYSVTISLYTQASGGSAFWATVVNVATKGGYFNLVLGRDGSVTSFAGVSFDQTYYVGIKVGLDAEMTPRQPLSSSPYAMNVADGSIERSKMVAGAVGTTTIANGAVLSGNIGGNTITAANIANGTITGNKLADATITMAKLDMYAALPVGTIVAWYNYPGLTKPANWVYCSGGTISDAQSPINGQTIPDLNNQRRFLRGGTSAGSMEADAMQGHNHNPTTASNFWGGTTSSTYNVPYGSGYPFTSQTSTGAPSDDGTHGTPRTASETRPVNMSVVWILKIK